MCGPSEIIVCGSRSKDAAVFLERPRGCNWQKSRNDALARTYWEVTIMK